MYTIPVASVLKFFSNDYMPVFTNTAVKTNAVTGEIDTVVINAAGSGYNNGTYDNVSINGDGAGGRVSIVVDGGKITSATVTSGGTGYTFGQISISAITGVGTGTGGEVDVIIPPPNGHGYDSGVELGGFRVMINAKLSYDEGAGDFPIDNDYRRIGLVTNPLKFGTAELIADLTVSAVKAVIFSPTFQGNYVPDEIVTQTRVVGGTNVTARGRVVSWNATTKVLKYYQNSVDGIFPEVTGTQNEFDGSNVISGATSGASGQPDVNFPAVPNTSSRTINNTEYDLGMRFNAAYAKPEIEPNSGQVVYIDNRRAISRANDQVEDIKIVIEF
jgi:hypothetical protein